MDSVIGRLCACGNVIVDKRSNMCRECSVRLFTMKGNDMSRAKRYDRHDFCSCGRRKLKKSETCRVCWLDANRPMVYTCGCGEPMYRTSKRCLSCEWKRRGRI